eukprot:PhM_4_TR9334/c0_g2_i1/m.76984/K17914/KIF13; kinesin family member 13
MSKHPDASDLCDEESESVRVYVRVRPFNRPELEFNKEHNHPNRSIVSMRGPNVALLDANDQYVEKDAMIFDDSFWSIPPEQQQNRHMPFATQQDVYLKVGTPLIHNMFEGYNSCIFAYGQTGSGKTYSMMGYGEDIGLIPRLCHGLFDSIEEDKKANPTRKYEVIVMFFEIYNEKVKDLFVKGVPGDGYQGLKVRNHPVTGPFVEGLETKKVFSAADCLRLIERGGANRTTKQTGMNDTSSRSHAVFKLEFTQTDEEYDDDGNPLPLQRISQMNLVDLAGSERVKKSLVSADKLTEATHINKSLTTLRKVIDALIDVSKGKKAVPPYRESMLTWVLSESLGGNSLTVMIAAVSPHFNNEEETHGTLRYALRAKSIVNKVRVNESKSSKKLREMKDQMAKLQALIASGEVGENAEIKAALKHEIERKQEEMHVWQEKERETHRVQAEMIQQLEDEQRKEEEMVKRANEMQSQVQEARVMAAEHRKKQFSAAFRNAFTFERKTKGYEQGTGHLRRQVSDLRRKVVAQETLEKQTQEEIEIYKEQRDKLNAQLEVLTTALVEKQQATIALSRRIDTGEAKISILKETLSESVASASARIGSLTEHFGELERHRQVTVVCVDRATVDSHDARQSHDEALHKLEHDGESRINKLMAQQIVLEQSVRNKSAIVAELTSTISKQEKQVSGMSAKLEDLRQQRKLIADDYVMDKAVVQREVADVKQQFTMDRAKSSARIGEGLSHLLTCRKIVNSLVHRPSNAELRAGKAGVQAWLTGLGLERHVPDFERSGFTDLHSVAHITEGDLQEMRIMGGSRRKVLQAAAELGNVLSEVGRAPGAPPRLSLNGNAFIENSNNSLFDANNNNNSVALTSTEAAQSYGFSLFCELERWLHDFNVCLNTVSPSFSA